MFKIKICKKCMNTQNEWMAGDVKGFFVAFSPNDNICPYCKNEIKEINITYEEYDTITSISKDINFLEKMIQLKNEDIVEYQLKLNQFKASVDVQSQVKKEESNKPKCPTCGSTKLTKVSTMSKAGSVFMFGLFSQKVKKTWHCENCKYEW